MGNKRKQNKLSLLSFNTLGTPFFAPYITKRYRKTAQLINSGNFDIICLQEIFTYYHFYLFKKKLTNYPYAIYQKNPFGPRGGLVIFSKLPLSNLEFVSFSYPPKTFIPIYTRLAQQGILSAQIEDFSIRIATTHLSSDTIHNLTPKNKLYYLIKSQSQEVATVINRYAQEQSLILAGDFNIAKKSALYQEFLHKAQANDVFANDEKPTYFPDRVSYFYRAPADRCDYIFYKTRQKRIAVRSSGYEFVKDETLSNNKKSYLSDHIGLHCILEVND